MTLPKIKALLRYAVLTTVYLIVPFMVYSAPDPEYPGAKPREESDSIGVRFLGGSGSAHYSTCKEGLEANVFRGGEGQSQYNSCPDDFSSIISKGGEGQTAYTTCPDDFSSLVFRGGEGQTFYTTCPDNLISIVSRGGEGQTFYTTCPDNLFSVISRGGEGQTFYTTCPDNLFDVISRGGEGQTFYTTCPDNFFDRISRGGEGQTFYTTCPDDFFSWISRGGIGQTFYSTCADITSLFVNKTIDAAKWCKTRTNNFKITVTNKNYAIYDLTNIVVRDSLGAGFNYSAWSATAGSYNPATGIWNIPSLARGQSHELTLSATADSVGTLTNQAWITSASEIRAVSKDTARVSVDILEGGEPRNEIRAQIYLKPDREINFNHFLDTLFNSSTWYTVSGPAISSDGKIHTNNLSPGRLLYTVKVEDDCITDSIRTYFKVISDEPVVKAPQVIEVCHQNETLINITTALGISTNGSWATLPVSAASHLATSAKGTQVFNTKEAFNNAAIPAINHNGGTNNAKKVEFYYTVNAPSTSLHNKVYTLILIITDRLY